MVLVELTNADASDALDISTEQADTEDLVSANRLYRQAALQAGETGMATLLDDLERVLVDVKNGPSELTAEDLDRLRERIESQGLLFKIRVTGTQVRERQRSTAAARPGTTS
jgi:hypothetical protein